MNKIKLVLYCLFLIQSFLSFSQQTAVYSNQNNDYNTAVELYNNQQYLAAQLKFEDVLKSNVTENRRSDCFFYKAFCAIKLNQDNADKLIEQFVIDYPTSVKQNEAFFEVAKYYFENKNYQKASEYFDKIDESLLSNNELETINFQKGYAFYAANNKKEATLYFNKVINSPNFGAQAKYYLGYMAYEKDDYKEANKQFKQVENQQKYSDKLSYFQADMNFKLGNFKKAIDLGLAALPKSNPTEQSELNKIIGESYFNLNEYAAALPFLEKYKGKNGKWNNTDFYQLGYVFYKQNDFVNAVLQFNKIIDGKDFVAQNAFYHLAASYLNLDKKQEALNAFKNAAETDFDKKIQEDAYFNYAKLSYELGNSYQSTPELLNAYLTKYPNSKNTKEIENLLINSYITSKNYKEALVLLDFNNNAENNIINQKVSFYYGLQLFNDADYVNANKLFFKSLQNSKDKNFANRANFWKGETEYILTNYDNAAASYKKVDQSDERLVNKEYQNINYNLAYCYFKLKQYNVAATYFQQYIANAVNDKIRLNDAYLRLGDCHFVDSKYALGLESYNKALQLNVNDGDYAQFQKAISYGFIGNNDKKIQELNILLKKYKASQYRDDALFELATAYVLANKTDMALQTFEILVTEFKNGLFTAKSILKQGLLYYSSQNDNLALLKFKKVAADYPKSAEAFEAIATAKLIYINNANVDAYAEWIKTLGYIELSNAELDNDTFESTEKQYLQKNTKQAQVALNNYIAKFPGGLHALNANFYVAQIYYNDGNFDNSIANYKFVASQPTNEFTEQALAKLSEIYLNKSDFVTAVPFLQRLETEANSTQNKNFATVNLMRSFYNINQYDQAVQYAELVSENDKIDSKLKSDAQIIIARSAIKTNDFAKAKAAYIIVSKIAKGELASEALFYDAYFKNKENKYLDSNKAVQKLAKEYSSYKYYGARGLVLMANNYYQLKDAFQATSILESVIENFTNYADVVAQAKIDLELIKTEQAKTNSSINK